MGERFVRRKQKRSSNWKTHSGDANRNKNCIDLLAWEEETKKKKGKCGKRGERRRESEIEIKDWDDKKARRERFELFWTPSLMLWLRYCGWMRQARAWNRTKKWGKSILGDLSWSSLRPPLGHSCRYLRCMGHCLHGNNRNHRLAWNFLGKGSGRTCKSRKERGLTNQCICKRRKQSLRRCKICTTGRPPRQREGSRTELAGFAFDIDRIFQIQCMAGKQFQQRFRLRNRQRLLPHPTTIITWHGVRSD